jgi:septal ring factor EnvC (AmiA/AmiB activator)
MSESSELIVIEEVKAVEVFTSNGIKPLIQMVREKALSEVPDMSTKKGRDRVRSLAAKVAKTKTALDSLGKELTEDWKKQAKVVDGSRKTMREELDSIRDEVRAPLTEYENREKNRVQVLDDFYDGIVNLSKTVNSELDCALTIEELEANLSKLELIVVDETLQERELDCIKAKARGVDKLKSTIEDIKQREKKERELEELRLKQAEKDREERERKIAEEAAEKAREEASKLIVQQQQEAEAREAQAKYELEQAEERAKQAAIKAEQDKQLAIDAEKARQKAEQERLEQEAIAREANIKHKKKTNNEAMQGFIDGGLSEEDAKTAVTLIAKGLIQHTKISY